MSKSNQPSCYVQTIRTAVPEKFLDQRQTEQKLTDTCINLRSKKLLKRIVRLTGIEKRHLAVLDFQCELDGEESMYRPASQQPSGPGMGVRTAMFDEAADRLVQRLLEHFRPERLRDIDTLITVSCTHASSPGLERPVFTHSAVPSTVDRWNLGFMGCSAALAAMRLVHQTAGLSKQALIISCELSSLHFQYTDRIDQMTANLLFADGSAAMVLSPRRSAVRLIDCQCAHLPEAADQMVWFADDHGLRLQLSNELPDTLGRCLPQLVMTFLRQHGLSAKTINHWLIHPGGPQILDSTQKALNLPDGALDLSREILRQFGNMSSPTILFILKELIDQKADGTALAISFGPGLTVEMVLLLLDHSAM